MLGEKTIDEAIAEIKQRLLKICKTPSPKTNPVRAYN